MRVVSVAALFGDVTEGGRERRLQRVLAEEPIDYGRVDLVLYLPVRLLGEFTADAHALLPRAEREWAALVRGRTPVLVLDYAHEGPAFAPRFARRIERLMEETGLPPEAIWFAQTNRRHAQELERSPSASEAARGIAHIDSHQYASALAARAEQQGLAAMGRANLADARVRGRKTLLCLNGAPRPHRAALAYWLARHPHRDRVFITFQQAAGRKPALAATAEPAAELLAAAGFDAPDLVPVLSGHAFDVDTSPDNVLGRRDLTVSPDLYRETLLSLVTETDLSPGSVVRYTEKALKPLLMGHPLLVLGNPGTLPLLEDLGFDVLRDVVPAAYDGIADPAERFGAVLDIAGRFLTDPPEWPWPPTIRDRLLANIALFEGPLLDTLRQRERLSIEAAARRVG